MDGRLRRMILKKRAAPEESTSPQKTIHKSSTHKKIACIFNYAPNYRASIYTLMDRHINCDFYFGANLRNGQNIRKMDLSALKGFKRESRVYFFRYQWQSGYPWFTIFKYRAFILTGQASLSNLCLLILCKIFKKKVFLWGHGIKAEAEMGSLLLRLFFHNVDGFFLYSDFGKSMMTAFGIPTERLYVVYNSLDYETQLEVRATIGPSDIFSKHFNNDLPVALFTGRLMPEKRLKMIIDAQQIAIAMGQPFNAVLVGDGPERESLEEQSRTIANGAYTWFYGECFDETELGELFYNADLCISPGNVGLTAVHALTYGTPVVTHGDIQRQMPEAEAISAGISGSFFEWGDVDDMWWQMRCWFKKTSTERAQLRKRCRQVIDEKYNPNYQLNVLRRALDDTL